MEERERERENTLETILNSKLDKWVGSNLLRTPLAAASCTDEGALLESKRCSRGSMDSNLDRATGSRNVGIKIRNRNLNLLNIILPPRKMN